MLITPTLCVLVWLVFAKLKLVRWGWRTIALQPLSLEGQVGANLAWDFRNWSSGRRHDTGP